MDWSGNPLALPTTAGNKQHQTGSRSWIETPPAMQQGRRWAGEEGLEPSNAGIKIRCLNQLGDSPTVQPSTAHHGCATLQRDNPNRRRRKLNPKLYGIFIPAWLESVPLHPPWHQSSATQPASGCRAKARHCRTRQPSGTGGKLSSKLGQQGEKSAEPEPLMRTRPLPVCPSNQVSA